MRSKRLAIILPSYNDLRISRAIRSIRAFDDIGTVVIVVIDGGSSADVQQAIQSALTADDVFVSERDHGIFDALNKGLDRCDTEFIGWLGSDDLFTGQVPASRVVAALEDKDLFIANLCFFHGAYITRITHALPARVGLGKFGLHNPHYATFGRAGLFKSERFEVNLRTSDQDYFLRIFKKRPRIASTSAISTLQEEGGFSSRSRSTIVRLNLELVSIFSRHTNWLVGPFAVLVKLIYKIAMNCYYRVLRRRASDYMRI